MRNYTLLELIAVIVIVGMISAFAVSQFRKMPAFISLDTKVNEFRKILAQARNSAACQGENTEVAFDSENRRIFIRKEGAEEESKNTPGMILPEEIKISRNKEDLGEDEDENITLFKFYPDGTGGGSSVYLELKKHKFEINISPLSGSILTEEVDGEK